ncbi:Mce protein [Mycobacterium talmoniae]|uniref:Mce protein n=1 Tax=Mycobacterium talmoniae TaxID=1858794 RepID=UPI000AFF5D74|nr:Mce protein [Mycobacterium talmoniae]
MKSSTDTAAVRTGDPDTGDKDAERDEVVDNPTEEPEELTENSDVTVEDAAADETPTDDSADPESDDEPPDAEEGAAEKSAKPARWWKRKSRVGSDSRDDGGRRTSLRRWLAAAVLVLVLAGAGYEGWLLYQQHQKDVAAAQALEAAQKFTLALTTIDPNAIDKNFAEVIDGATGEFKDMYTQSTEQLRQLLIENKAVAHGTVIEAAVKSATKNKVVVVLFIDQSVSNAAVPQPQLDRSRITMTMEKVDGRWLASKLEMP